MPQFIGGGSTTGGRPHPYGRITNRIVTRGMGPHINRLVTQGYGGPPAFVVAAFQRGLIFGQSGRKRRLRELETVIVWAKLLEVNGRVPPKKIEGFVRIPVDWDRGFAAVMAEHVSSRVKKAIEGIKVFVRRIK
jgi:hypothetical protein